MTKTEKKLSSKKDTKDQIIEQYKTTIKELISKISKLEKKIEKFKFNDKNR